ncbi:MAG: helix-turn-helix domain-containing protein [Pacificimonas sp.]
MNQIMPQRDKSDAMRTRLLAAGRHLFGAHGFANTSQAMICAEAGVSRGALNHHYPDGKRGLFEVVARAAVEEMAALSPSETTGDALDEYLDIALRPDIFRITIQDAPAVFGVTAWRRVEQDILLPPVARALGSTLRARLVYGTLLEATICLFEAEDPVALREEVRAELSTMLPSA